MATTDLNVSDFEKALERGGILLVDCWAGWCAPCRAFAPIYERVSALHPDVTFAKVDVEREPDLARGFGVRSIPTLVVFRDRLPVFAHAGLLSDAALDALVKEVKALDMADVRKLLAEAGA